MKYIKIAILAATASALLPSCGNNSSMSPELAEKINSDARIDTVCVRAERLVKGGLNAGDGYAEVWIRDLNTFISVACEVSDRDKLKDALANFFRFQGEDGNIDDGYVQARPGMTGYDYKFTDAAPGLAAHKNTVETDQETSLVQAVYKYVKSTGDTAFLSEEISGRTVMDRMGDALRYLLNERWVPEYGLLWGATTADWGDVQPEHPWGVALDENSHHTGSFTWRQNRSLDGRFDDRTCLCDLYIGRRLFKNGLGEISIGVTDLFDGNARRFTHSISTSGTNDGISLGLGRYFAVHFVYNLRYHL